VNGSVSRKREQDLDSRKGHPELVQELDQLAVDALPLILTRLGALLIVVGHGGAFLPGAFGAHARHAYGQPGRR